VTFQSVSSSCIAEVGYDPSDNTLAIRFRGGREYRYAGIPPETHEALLVAGSVGGYFNAQIRDVFPFQRATPACRP
jgi:hypothetical protein